jgi:hypothetical protein
VQPEAQVQAILAEQTIQFLLMLDGEITEVRPMLLLETVQAVAVVQEQMDQLVYLIKVLPEVLD